MIYLISFDTLKENGLIHEHVDSKVLRYTQRVVQDESIENAVGKDLYARLQQAIEDEESSNAYTELIDNYCVMPIVCWCNYRIIHHLNNKITNKAVGSDNDEYKTANTTQEDNAYKSDLIRDAKFYTKKLIDYLEDNYTDFPEYERKCGPTKTTEASSGFTNWLKV